MRRIRRWTAFLLILTLTVCLAGCRKNDPEQPEPTEQVESTRDKYDRAQSLLAQDRFADAAAVFGELGSYEESARLTMYCTAAAAGEAGDYDTAAFTFEKLGDYKESKFMIAYYRAREQEAKAEQENPDRWNFLTEAAEEYESLAGFRDSAGRAADCRKKAEEAVAALEAPAGALYEYGKILMEQGDVQKALPYLEKCREQDPYFTVDPESLMLLATAYEEGGRTDDAAAVYEEIYTRNPKSADAYQAHIRILLNRGQEGDLKHAAELMERAYQETGIASFKSQRNDLLPSPPEANPAAAYYEAIQNLTLTSTQGCDIYYTFQDDAALPDGGTKYTEPILLEEGTFNLRAVCVNGELVSDELKATYRIIMPGPRMPQCTLAPNTYKTRQTVKLKPGKGDTDNDDIRIYYTIDGSTPDSDSPVYNGEAVKLGTGNVTLHAVAVNKYNKVSNMLEIRYKIDADPKPKAAFTDEDMISDIPLGSYLAVYFYEKYGEGEPGKMETTDEYPSAISRHTYPWGYAVMHLSGNKNAVVQTVTEISFTENGVFTAPRGTGIGDTEEDVVAAFRDMGQVESPSHNRGLYANDKGSGKIWQEEDGTRIIRYTYTENNHTLRLEYHLRDGRVFRIDMKYTPY